ncbi:MAG: hypothetical protein U0325_12190 [Polyangiales bacterium]
MSELRWKVHAARARFPDAARRVAVAAVITLGATVTLGRWAALGGVAASALLGAVAAWLRRGRALPAGEAATDANALRLGAGDGAFVLPAREVRAGWVVPGAQSASVVFERADGARVALTVDDTASAQEVLGAMGFDAQRRSLKVSLGRGWDGPLRALGVLLFGGLQTLPLLALFAAWLHLGPVSRALLFASVTVAGFIVASRTMGPPELTIGADGITLQRGFQPRFLPYRLLRWIERDGDDLVLLLVDDQRIRVTPTSRDAARDDMVVERIRGAAERARAQGGNAALALLDRNGRSVRAWREALRALRGAPGYRDAGLGEAELQAVLADPGASAERRIAAAVALASHAPTDDLTRVRVAVDACADPALREAVASALRGDLDDEAMELAADESRDVAELRRGLGV